MLIYIRMAQHHCIPTRDTSCWSVGQWGAVFPSPFGMKPCCLPWKVWPRVQYSTRQTLNVLIDIAIYVFIKLLFCRGVPRKELNNRSIVRVCCTLFSVHPSCYNLDKKALTLLRGCGWQCLDCKSCQGCSDSGRDEAMMCCDQCDRGYHYFCVGLGAIPEGEGAV